MKQWESQSQRSSNQAQALLEFAVLGSILIMLLAVLINYGLRYNYQQRVMQYAFRQALVSAHPDVASASGTPSSVQHVVLQDKHIPEPANPFAVGSVIPVSGSAGVNRSYTYNIPENYSELPEIQIEINDSSNRYSYKTAGIRRNICANEAQVKKYIFIYGAGNIDDVVENGCGSGVDLINIIDTSAGEIIDYNSALRRCRMLVDKEVCIEQCQQSPAEINCNSVCNQDIEIPWYCQEYTEVDPSTHKYKFPMLNKLFYPPLATARRDMGLQSDYTAETTAENVLHKQEDSNQITTTDNLNWQETKTRNIIHRDYTATSDDQSGEVKTDEVETSVGQQRTPPGWETAH